MNNPYTVFDLESAPLPRERLEQLIPEIKAHPACKSPESISKSIAERTADFYEKAALSALFGRIVVIGTLTPHGEPRFIQGEEKAILEEFWGLVAEQGQADMRWAYWSGCGAPGGFDLRYVIQRSMILGVRIPSFVRNGRFFTERIVDLAAVFLLHDPTAYLSLSNAAKVMGLIVPGSGLTVKSKHDEVTGANFHQFYLTDPHKALGYLVNDLKLTAAIASRVL